MIKFPLNNIGCPLDDYNKAGNIVVEIGKNYVNTLVENGKNVKKQYQDCDFYKFGIKALYKKLKPHYKKRAIENTFDVKPVSENEFRTYYRINKSIQIYKTAFSMLSKQQQADFIALNSFVPLIKTDLAKVAAPLQVYNCVIWGNKDNSINRQCVLQYIQKIIKEVNT